MESFPFPPQKKFVIDHNISYHPCVVRPTKNRERKFTIDNSLSSPPPTKSRQITTNTKTNSTYVHDNIGPRTNDPLRDIYYIAETRTNETSLRF